MMSSTMAALRAALIGGLAISSAQGVPLAQIEATCEFTATSQAVEGGGLTSVSHGPELALAAPAGGW